MWKAIKWFLFKRNYVTIPGDHCGICGKWVAVPYTIPSYQDVGWYITICDNCKYI